MALYYTFLAFLDSRDPGLPDFFSDAPEGFFPLKNKGSIAVSIILRLNWDEKYFDLRFLEKNEKIRKFFRFQKCVFCFVPVYVRVLANSPGARRTVIESLEPGFATGSSGTFGKAGVSVLPLLVEL